MAAWRPRPLPHSETRLRTCRQFIEAGGLFLDIFDHIPAQQEGFHFFQQGLSRTPPGAGGTQHLVAGKNVEVAVQILDIRLHVGGGLGSIHNGDGPHLVGPFHHFLHRPHHAQHVAHRCKGNDFGPFVDLGRSSSVSARFHPGTYRPVPHRSSGSSLPGNQVGWCSEMGITTLSPFFRWFSP